MRKFLAIIGSAMLVLGAASISAQPATAASCVVVKNVVGKNYQTAQDIWRAQGFYVMPARDGKGWGRSAWLDRNWKVIGQTPKAGACVKRYSDVRATIIKYTD